MRKEAIKLMAERLKYYKPTTNNNQDYGKKNNKDNGCKCS